MQTPKQENNDIPKALLRRIPAYYHYLNEKAKENTEYISSTTIAESLHLTAIQVRKDLALISSTSGKPRLGFEIRQLLDDIKNFLGYNIIDNAILVGAGQLGRTLLSYDGFKEYGLNIACAFDSAKELHFQKVNNKYILPLEKMNEFVKQKNIRIGIITVPKQHAQDVCDLLIEAGIKGIWNFAPTHLEVPESVSVKDENMAISLALLSRELADFID